MNSGQFGSSGFTIVETMIFLAVSSAILVSALGLVNGAQNKTQFTQGINDLSQQINDVMSTVSTGYNASQANFTCSVTGTGAGTTLNFAGGVSAQGTNGGSQGCIFIGRIMQFTSVAAISTYSVAGAQMTQVVLPQPVTTMDDAHPTIIPASYIDDQSQVKDGVTVTRICYDKGAGCVSNKISAIGFFETLGNLDSSNNLSSGSQQVDTVAIKDSPSALPATTSPPALTSIMSTAGYKSYSNPANGITICLEGGSNQFAQITIGQSGRQTSTTVKREDVLSAPCV